ncbi:MAG: glycosyltransferase [Chitinophagaceae bacterium]|nr:glycosyltransferase [Chitinophagaceae bacterium]
MISIVVPLYNHAGFVSEALSSVCASTGLDFEVVVVDDGSTDGSDKIVREFLKGNNVTYQFVQQENQGAHAAINRGVAEANGEWIAILNSDDKFSPSRVSKLVDHALQTNSQFVFSRVSHMDENGLPLPHNSPQLYYYNWSVANRDLYPTPNFELLRHNYAITTGNFFFRRSIFEKIGPFRDFKICHDWDFILRALLVTEISFLDEVLYEYRVHPNNTIRPEVQDLRYQEMDSLLSNYLRQAETASNPLAPSYKNWGAYWMKFIGSQIPFGYLPETSEAVKQILSKQGAGKKKVLLDHDRQEMLVVALENAQKKALHFQDELFNSKKYLENQSRKSLLIRLKERLKGRLSNLYSKVSISFGKKKQ